MTLTDAQRRALEVICEDDYALVDRVTLAGSHMVNATAARALVEMGLAEMRATQVRATEAGRAALLATELTPVQRKALALAREHGCVFIGAGFGRSEGRNEIPSATYRRLVFIGLLTPHYNGEPFMGAALSIYSGKVGYLTEKAKALPHGGRG